jgi:hypothetical protein
MQAPRARFVAREVGPATIAVLVGALLLLWLVARPAGEPTRRYVGQLFGAESILLLSIGLVLISTLPWVEEWFDGIDRAAIWHRRVAISGLGLLGLVLWAILRRWQSVVPGRLRGVVRDAPGVPQVRRVFGGYERWRALHRTTGLFVADVRTAGDVALLPTRAAPGRRAARADPPRLLRLALAQPS